MWAAGFNTKLKTIQYWERCSAPKIFKSLRGNWFLIGLWWVALGHLTNPIKNALNIFFHSYLLTKFTLKCASSSIITSPYRTHPAELWPKFARKLVATGHKLVTTAPPANSHVPQWYAPLNQKLLIIVERVLQVPFGRHVSNWYILGGCWHGHKAKNTKQQMERMWRYKSCLG